MALTNHSRFRIIFASIIGNMLEWYDFALFGIFAVVLAQHFFPKDNPKAALAGSLGVFAVGYLMRPIGGAIIGHMGDRRSRRLALVLAILLMGIATTLIGLLPTYSHVGLWATWSLVLLRMIQGLAVGGEFPGSIVILAENSHPRRRAFTISLALVGAILGMLMGSGVGKLIGVYFSESEFAQFGWRLAFLIGVVLAGIGLYIRVRIWPEEQLSLERVPHLPFWQLLKENKKSLVIAFFILSIGAVLTGVLSIFLITYLTTYMQLPLQSALSLLFVSSLVSLVAFPLSAWIADCFNVHRSWLLVSLIGLAVISPPLFLLMQYGKEACEVAVIILTFLAYFSIGPFTPLVVDLFPKTVRYSGVAIIHGLVFSIVTGMAPLFVNALIVKFGVMVPGYCISFSALFAWVSVYFSKRVLLP